MAFSAFFDGPHNYNGKYNYFLQGGSPKLVKDLIGIIEENKNDIVEINLCWYLFNNLILHEYLKNLPKNISINVITIPLEGYDNSSPKKLQNIDTGMSTKKSYTKYDIAKKIFEEVFRASHLSNYHIFFFPHIYVRSPFVKKFSRGKLPYSLHLKAAFIKKKDQGIVALSSSNLAVRDLVKYESLLVVEDDPLYENAFASFFHDLISCSIHIKDFTSQLNVSKNSFPVIERRFNTKSFFTAPFYFDSANRLEVNLSQLISKAKNRIIIGAQHLAAYKYHFNTTFHSSNNNNKRDGILGAVLERARNGIGVTCLSQTFSPPNSTKGRYKNHRFRSPANTKNFQTFFNELEKLSNASYFVNENFHSKIIIIDDMLIFCTYNFTPTQFIYLDKVNISNFKEMPGLSYKGIHCEVSGHIIVEDQKTVTSFMSHIKEVIDSVETVKVL